MQKLLEQQREQIQNDLLCILNGLDQDMLDNVCDVIVSRFQILIEEAAQQTIPPLTHRVLDDPIPNSLGIDDSIFILEPAKHPYPYQIG